MSTHRLRPILVGAIAIWVASAAGGHADDGPHVVADIAPVASLVARVMQGVGTPDQIVQPGASPHGYALRPSEASALERADAIFWVGPELTPWLEDAIDTVAPDAEVTRLLHAPGTSVLDFREGPRFDAGSAGHAGDHGHSQGADAPAAQGREQGRAPGAEREGHDHSGDDPHAWLDPDNAKAWLSVIAGVLSRLDPANAAIYEANAEGGQAEIDAADDEIALLLAPLKGARFVVFHDAYHYFEHHFGLPAAGAIAEGDAADPGPARIEVVRGMIRDLEVGCVLSEPALNPAAVATAIEGSAARAGVIDPLGAGISPGPGFYPALLRDVASRLIACAG